MSEVERPSLREIFDEYAPYVWRALRHLGVHDADLEDVCQNVFITIHRKLPDFEGRSTIQTWVYGICLRTASDYRRRAHIRREAVVSEPPVRSIPASQLDEVERREARQWLDGALGELDEDKRAVFVLYELEELPMKQVAQIIGCPLQTAYSRLHAARELVLEMAKKRAMDDEP